MTNTILGVPYYIYSIASPKALLKILIIKATIVLLIVSDVRFSIYAGVADSYQTLQTYSGQTL